MKYAIISDLHANLDALKRVLEDASECGAERIICLGDIVGYGPLPAETLKLVRETAAVVIAGNHDDAVSGRMDATNFIDLAGDAVSRHREALARDEIAWLKGLPYTASIEDAVLTHGDLTTPEAFNYIDDEDVASTNFEMTDTALVFVGHTHVPGIYLTGQSGRVYALGPEDFVLEDGKRYIVNVGSVGYPRESEGQCYSSYVLYDTSDKSVRFRKLPFTVASVLQRGPSRRKRNVLITLAAAVVLVAGGIIAGFLTGSDSARLPPLQERRLLVDGARTVCANMKLEKDSPNALLTIDFWDINDKELPPVIFNGKSSAKKFKVPPKAVKALVAIRPVAEGSQPIVKTFAPVAE